MFLSHQYLTDGWAVVWLSVVETVGQVGVGAELPIPLQCSVRRPLAAVQQQPTLLPWPEEREKRRKAFVPAGWTTPAAATGCGGDAFCLQSSLFRGRQASAKINRYSMNLWSALVSWVTSLSLMGSVMLRDVVLHHTDTLSHSGHSASHIISHASGSFAFPDQYLP